MKYNYFSITLTTLRRAVCPIVIPTMPNLPPTTIMAFAGSTDQNTMIVAKTAIVSIDNFFIVITSFFCFKNVGAIHCDCPSSGQTQVDWLTAGLGLSLQENRSI